MAWDSRRERKRREREEGLINGAALRFVLDVYPTDTIIPEMIEVLIDMNGMSRFVLGQTNGSKNSDFYTCVFKYIITYVIVLLLFIINRDLYIL